jgi:hypothetical protein
MANLMVGCLSRPVEKWSPRKMGLFQGDGLSFLTIFENVNFSKFLPSCRVTFSNANPGVTTGETL